MNGRKILFLVTYTLALVVAIEVVSEILLDPRERKSLFINDPVRHDEVFETNIYCIHPLLGWTFNPDKISTPYKLNDGIIELSSYTTASDDTLRILITGGSTSDLIYDPDSWPLFLFEMLKKDRSVELYLGAVGGYNSGQELLKTLNFLLDHRPDVHVSYSGANEVVPSHTRYVSQYEEQLFDQLIHGNPMLLPNTVTLGRRVLGLDRTPMVSTNGSQPDAEHFGYWKQNMQALRALGTEFHYSFVAVLQPVFGVGSHVKHELPSQSIDHMVVGYKEFYPPAMDFAFQEEFVEDFTNIFQNESDFPFVDDCHLKKAFQVKLAESMYEMLKTRGWSVGIVDDVGVVEMGDKQIGT